MNVIRETRFSGVLPAGLILNATLPAKSRIGLDGVLQPNLGNYSGPLPSQSVSLSLRGEFLDPVLMADLGSQANYGPYNTSSAPGAPTQLDPYHNAVMLMTNVAFTGLISEIDGNSVVARLTEVSKYGIGAYQQLYPVQGNSILKDQSLCAPAMACDVYIPATCRTKALFGLSSATYSGMLKGVMGLHAAVPTEATKPLYASKDYVASGYEFKLPTYAHDGMVTAVPKTETNVKNAIVLVPASLKPFNASGQQLAQQNQFAFAVSPELSATVLTVIKNNGVYAEGSPAQAIQDLQRLKPKVSHIADTYVSFSQIGTDDFREIVTV